jgi:RimJ/RimL family protein N-acetyltransferase
MTGGTLTTERLLLDPISRELAQRIIAGAPLASDAPWHPEYPFADELAPLGMLARAVEAPHPVFGLFQIRTRDDGLAVGGIGFFGPPDSDARVELGYGLIASARGRGYATEAVRALVAVARRHGARSLAADTELDNAASQHVLRKAGFSETRRDGRLAFFELVIPEEASTRA